MEAARCVDRPSDQIRQDIEQTKSALQDHLRLLETEVRRQVDDVKDAVGETVESVKDSLDVREHVRRHPKVSFGLAALAGVIISKALEEPRRHAQRQGGAGTKLASEPRTAHAPAGEVSESRAPGGASKFFSQIGGHFEHEIHQLSGIAIGLLFSAAKNWIQKARVESPEARQKESHKDRLSSQISQSPHVKVHGSGPYAPTPQGGGRTSQNGFNRNVSPRASSWL